MKNLDPTQIAQIAKEGLGPFLRRLREEKDLSLRSLSEHTRIRTYYLESMEKGDFDKLPTGPVGLGFVRAFADAVGADSNAVVASYKREIQGDVQLDGYEPEPRVVFGSPRRVNRFSSVATLIFVLIFLLAAGGILWFMRGRTEQLVPVESIVGRIKSAFVPLTKKLPGVGVKSKEVDGVRRETPGVEKVEKKVPDPDDRQVSSVKSEAPPVAEEEKSPSPPAENPAAIESSPTPNPSPAGSGPADSGELPLTLRVFATEDTWLRIVVDEKNTEEILLLAGNEKNWKGSEKFALTVGNMAGAQISLNGEEIALPKNDSNVLRDFVITKKYLN